MFELHDALAYLMSIGVIFSFAYLYLHILPAAGTDYGIAASSASLSLPRLTKPSIAIFHIRINRLTRQIKRKESPDDDSSACSSLLNEDDQAQQGGRWKQWIHTKNRTSTAPHFRRITGGAPIMLQ
ncbi:hypothetical protein ACFPYJ_08580 [Paenibacillus solisilvae]|uniref:Uncharacterized protein n=1 Tax=Paenibacillus solisilvae TaxID=2486751 RepID=A0ABW0VWD9_9BACL